MRILLETTSETKPEHIYDTLDGEGQQDNLDTEETMLPIDDSELPQELGGNESLDFTDPDFAKFKPIPLKDVSVMKKEVCQILFEQRIVFNKIVKYCKDEMIKEKTGKIEPKPPLMIAHGGAGVGKTYLINTLATWIHKINQREGLHPLQPYVLLLAPKYKQINGKCQSVGHR